MTTVYQHCKEEADVCRTVAKRVPTKRMRDSLMAHAQMWEDRAGRLSVEDGSRDVKSVVLHKLFEVKEDAQEEAVVNEDDDEDED